MKITFDIDAKLVAALKREAARQGRTASDLVERALRLLLQSWGAKAGMPPLPTFHGQLLVDIDDRDALYRAMEEE